MAITRAMLMAAGLGTRLRPFTDFHPKALMPLMGIPMAQFAIDALLRAGVKQIVANIHHHAEKSRTGLLALEHGTADLVISDESQELLGSAGGLRKAVPLFQGDPFFLINADVLCDIDLRALARTHQHLRSSRGVALTLAVFPEPPTSGKYREIYLDSTTGLVSGFSPDLKSGRPFFIGSAILEAEALRNVPMSGPSEFVPTILEPLVREKRVGFHLTSGTWKDIGAPELWLEAHLYLIDALETGRLSGAWRERLEGVNERLANGIWASKTSLSRRVSVLSCSSRWAAPCYFAGAAATSHLGPQAALYGSSFEGPALERGIGMSGLWISLVKTMPRH